MLGPAAHSLPPPLLLPQDYREDGMDLGSDAGSSSSSRASSQSNSTKVTPCSECKSSSSPGGSLDLVSALEDYEEPFPVYQKKVIDEWAPEEDGEEEEEEDERDERGYRDDRCPAREPGDVSARTRGGGGKGATTVMPPPVPNGNLHPHDPQDLRHNGNVVVVAGRPSGSRGSRRAVQKPQPTRGRRGGRGPAAGVLCLQPTDGGTCVPEEPPVPPMDWEALEKHLAGLQFREQEVRNQGQARTNSTSVSWPGCVPTRAHTRTHPAHRLHAPSWRSHPPPAPFFLPRGWGPGLRACLLLPWGTVAQSGSCLGLPAGRRGGRGGQRAAESRVSGTGDSF